MDVQEDSDKPQYLANLLAAIEHNLTLGWVCCQTAKQYRSVVVQDEVVAHSWMHLGNYIACQREAIMTLARLTDVDRQSLSLPKLVRYSKANPREYQHATVEQVLALVNEHEKWLDEHQVFIKVRGLRDKIFAHTDKVVLSNPSSLAAYNVDFDEVEACFADVHDRVENYRLLYDGSKYYLDSISSDIEREMKYELEARRCVEQRRLDQLQQYANAVKEHTAKEG